MKATRAANGTEITPPSATKLASPRGRVPHRLRRHAWLCLNRTRPGLGCPRPSADRSGARMGRQRPPQPKPHRRCRRWTARPEAVGFRNRDADHATATAGVGNGCVEAAVPQDAHRVRVDLLSVHAPKHAAARASGKRVRTATGQSSPTAYIYRASHERLRPGIVLPLKTRLRPVGGTVPPHGLGPRRPGESPRFRCPGRLRNRTGRGIIRL